MRMRGFTLLEILIAVTLGSVALTLLSSMVWIMSARTAPELPNVLNLKDFQRLSRILKGTATLPAASNTGQFKLTAGPDWKLSALCAQGGKSYPDGPNDIAQLTLDFRPGTGLKLTLDRGFLLRNIEMHVLFKSAERILIACLDQQGKWQNQWTPPDQTGIPTAIRITAFIDKTPYAHTCILPIGSNIP